MYPAIYREMAIHGRMTTKQLAQHLDLSPKTMGKKMSGESEFTIKEMFAIQSLFGGLPLDELFQQITFDPTTPH